MAQHTPLTPTQKLIGFVQSNPLLLVACRRAATLNLDTQVDAVTSVLRQRVPQEELNQINWKTVADAVLDSDILSPSSATKLDTRELPRVK
jgi:hypothetical protein